MAFEKIPLSSVSYSYILFPWSSPRVFGLGSLPSLAHSFFAPSPELVLPLLFGWTSPSLLSSFNTQLKPCFIWEVSPCIPPRLSSPYNPCHYDSGCVCSLCYCVWWYLFDSCPVDLFISGFLCLASLARVPLHQKVDLLLWIYTVSAVTWVYSGCSVHSSFMDLLTKQYEWKWRLGNYLARVVEADHLQAQNGF